MVIERYFGQIPKNAKNSFKIEAKEIQVKKGLSLKYSEKTGTYIVFGIYLLSVLPRRIGFTQVVVDWDNFFELFNCRAEELDILGMVVTC